MPITTDILHPLDPAFAEALKAKNAAANARAKAKMDDLTERAKTDPEAARDLEEKIERRRSYSLGEVKRQIRLYPSHRGCFV